MYFIKNYINCLKRVTIFKALHRMKVAILLITTIEFQIYNNTEKIEVLKPLFQIKKLI